MVYSLALILPLLAAALSRAEDHLVTVGNQGQLAYYPSNIAAKVGDTITFEFHQKNHTATQSAFDTPCSPLSGGFNSGFMPVADGVTSGFPKYTITVKDDKPIWVHCEQTGHCAKGMVFAANAPTYGNTFDAFKAKAIASNSTSTTTSSAYGSYSTSSSSSSKDHVVSVGVNGKLLYDPQYITVPVGDTITFQFHQKNHTATQSAFDTPCSPLSGGFNSGFMPVAADKTDGFPTYTITVKDDKPIWVHCEQTGHCPSGMVFAANAPSSGNTFDAFKAKAIASNATSTTTSSAYGSSSTGGSNSSKDHVVSVGAYGKLLYDPEYIQAPVGDTITFQFHQKNHTATQSAFDTPCSPLSGGFNSGFMPVAANVTDGFPTYTVTIKDDKPIWVHCEQTGHCPSGMVFAANAPSSGNTFDAFKAKAIASNATSTTTSSAYGSSSTGGSNSSKDHVVSVGAYGKLLYDPEYIQAPVGDTITFQFHQKNHTATQSAFDTPCSPLSGGFNSGFMPVAANVTDGFPTYTVTIKDDKPIWVHCEQTGHCPSGMVFAANAPSSGNTFDAFKAKAIASNVTSTTTSSAYGSSSTGGSNGSKDHVVSVGAYGKLLYDPEYIQAPVGDTITFQFHQKNHTATQSAFDTPCSPLSGGFNSGFMPVAANVTDGFPTYTVTIKDDKPIWVHCEQTGHCPSGMVFAANAPSSGNTFDAFKAKAIASNASSTTTSAAYGSQTSSSSSPSSSGSYGSPKTHTIIVGGAAGLVYTPPTVEAAVGDIIEFQFQVKNHTVTQSPFSNPCTNLETATHGTMKGFDSGFMPVAPNATTFPTFRVTVNDTNPFWGYCRQEGHCVAGMVFGINPPKSGPNTFEAFQQLAEHSNATSLAYSVKGY